MFNNACKPKSLCGYSLSFNFKSTSLKVCLIDKHVEQNLQMMNISIYDQWWRVNPSYLGIHLWIEKVNILLHISNFFHKISAGHWNGFGLLTVSLSTRPVTRRGEAAPRKFFAPHPG